MAPPPNNTFELPVLAVLFAVCVAAAILYATRGVWLLAVVAAVGAVAMLFGLRVVRRGDNPWWVRSPVDRFYRN